LHVLVAVAAVAALERLELDVTLEVLVQGRGVRLVHLVDLGGVVESGDRSREDNDHVVVGRIRAKMGEVVVCIAPSVLQTRPFLSQIATYAVLQWPELCYQPFQTEAPS
jgi:hypothetical protein